jgi:hypothetical protein
MARPGAATIKRGRARSQRAHLRPWPAGRVDDGKRFHADPSAATTGRAASGRASRRALARRAFDRRIAATRLRHQLQICIRNRRHGEAAEGLAVVSV